MDKNITFETIYSSAPSGVIISVLYDIVNYLNYHDNFILIYAFIVKPPVLIKMKATIKDRMS
jgi:hypothetical protein